MTLDCNDEEFFLFGFRYEQLEPAYGGTTDTAADVRASCAMGLVAFGYSRALGESRLDGALAPLREAWSEPLLNPELRRALLQRLTELQR